MKILYRSFKLLPSFLLLILINTVYICFSLNNGLARTPPKGWMQWERFRCNTDCENDSLNCVSEFLMKSTADAMVADGWLAAGYEYLAIDDCWMYPERDPITQRLQADPSRFPNGIKSLADYLHARGLKLGVYADVGATTCAGYPGSQFALALDAQTFAEWGVDMVKLDGCNIDAHQIPEAYEVFGAALNASGRPVLYLCGWPLDQILRGVSPDAKHVFEVCNLARISWDVEDQWISVAGITSHFNSEYGLNMTQSAGPGGWTDADELVLADFGLSYEQQRAQVAIWAIFPSAFFISTDLRLPMDPRSHALLTNKHVFAILDDALGAPGRRIWKRCGEQQNDCVDGVLEVYRRPLSDGAFAIAILNRQHSRPARERLSFTDVFGLDPSAVGDWLDVYEGFTSTLLGTYHTRNSAYSAIVPPTGVDLTVIRPHRSAQSLLEL